MLAALAAVALTAPALTFEALRDGEEFRYPVVVVRGATTASSLTATNRTTRETYPLPVAEGRFGGVVELMPGPNVVRFQAGDSARELRLVYRPATTPYRTQAWMAVGSDGPAAYEPEAGKLGTDWRSRIGASVKLMQGVNAELMRSAGYGRMTFATETDARRDVVVRLLRMRETGAELRAMDPGEAWQRIYRQLPRQPGFQARAKHLVITGYVRYDPATKRAAGHSALGGGYLAVFSGATLATWPARVADSTRALSDPTPIDPARQLDDSVGRTTNWGVASTTLGAWLHEWGHTVGLPHVNDPYCVMSRGFDFFSRRVVPIEAPSRRAPEPRAFPLREQMRWTPYFAARLRWSPWMRPDGEGGKPFDEQNGPTITVEGEEIVVRAPHGLRVFGAHNEDRNPWFREYPFDAPKEARFRLATILAQTRGRGWVTAIDGQGNIGQIDSPRER